MSNKHPRIVMYRKDFNALLKTEAFVTDETAEGVIILRDINSSLFPREYKPEIDKWMIEVRLVPTDVVLQERIKKEVC